MAMQVGLIQYFVKYLNNNIVDQHDILCRHFVVSGGLILDSDSTMRFSLKAQIYSKHEFQSLYLCHDFFSFRAIIRFKLLLLYVNLSTIYDQVPVKLSPSKFQHAAWQTKMATMRNIIPLCTWCKTPSLQLEHFKHDMKLLLFQSASKHPPNKHLQRAVPHVDLKEKHCN